MIDEIKEVISIHALVKRATVLSRSAFETRSYFNPRPREEGDNGDKCDKKQIIHFNPRPREEGDLL